MPKYQPPQRSRPKKANSEDNMHLNTVLYLKREYPEAVFFTDFAAGLYLPPWLAVKRKQLQSSGRGFPDIIVLSPQQGYHGLALELKRPGTRMRKKDGKWADDRLKRQNAMLERLDDLGYAAYFAVGLDQAKIIVDWYFGRGPTLITFGRQLVMPPKTAEVNVDAEENF